MNDAVNSQISRIVAWALAPLITIASGYVANEAQVLFNAHLDGTQLSIYLGSVMIPVGITLATWVFNRGKHELATLNQTNPDIGLLVENAVNKSIAEAMDLSAKQGVGETGTAQAPPSGKPA